MCGRYTGYVDDSDELKTIYTAAKRASPRTELKTGEIFPTDTAPILVPDGSGIQPIPGYWGYPGFKGSNVLINARAETASQKPTFAASFRTDRCVVPTTGYLEWDRHKTKYLIREPETTILYLAGLYRLYGETAKFVILTTAANSSVAEVHHRMPVILHRNELRAWTMDLEFAARHAGATMPALERKQV